MPPNYMTIFSTFLLAVLSFSLFPSTLSRIITNHPSSSSSHTTTIFHVSASIKQSQNALSFHPQNLVKNFQPHHIPPNTTSSFSLPLHPRLSLQNPSFNDYKTLVRSRLARDAARVEFLNDKLELALNGDKKTGRPELQPEDLSVPVSSGRSQGSSEYFARIGIGQPAQLFYLVPDTGSDINWLQCQPCQKCYNQTDSIFNPTTSSTYTSLSCTSQQCQALDSPGCQNDNKCLYKVSYGDGSFTVGELATETLSCNSKSETIPNIVIGCGHDNEGLFFGAAGLLGLGGGPLSLSSQIKATSFSYCLVDPDTDSSSTLDFNSGQSSYPITSPLLKNEKFSSYRYIGVTGFSVGGIPLSISPTSFNIEESGSGGVILDSGTIITRLQTQVYETLRDSFLNMTSHLPSAKGDSLFDTCYDLSSQTDVQVPAVAIQFAGGKSLRLPANNYLIKVDSAGTFCFAFAATTSSLSIIGNFQQQGIRVTYDLAHNLVGFSPNQC